MKRVMLFLTTNLAIIVVLSITLRLLGVERILDARITTIIAELVIGILASLIVFWFSRRREFRADAGGARLAGRERMIGALDRLRASYGWEPLPDHMAAFGISGATRRGMMRLFMTHPPIEERIERLRRAG